MTTGSTFNGTIHSSDNLTLQSGNFDGVANLAGTTAWTGGTIVGTFTVRPGATLNLTGSGPKTVDRRACVAHQLGSDEFRWRRQPGAQQFRATHEQRHIKPSVRRGLPIPAGGAPTFSNTGTLTKTAGSGTSAIGISNAFAFSNAGSGVIDVQIGTIQVNGGFATNSGTINTAAGTTFSTNGNALTNAASGVMQARARSVSERQYSPTAGRSNPQAQARPAH